MGSQVAFTQDIRQRIDEAKERQLDEIDGLVAAALRSAVGELLGVRWDWGRWEFDPHKRVNGNDVQGSIIRRAVAQKADQLAPTLIDRALQEPLRFTAKDVATLRSVLKDEVMDHAEAILRQRAHEIAERALDEQTVSS